MEILAVENMMLAAQFYGIGSVWLSPLMTLCDEPEIWELLNRWQVPKQHIVWAAVALGYPKVPGKFLVKKENVECGSGGRVRDGEEIF